MEKLKKRVFLALVFILVYALLVTAFMDWRQDHLFFMSFLSVALIVHRWSYNVVLFLSAFILFWISYDFMRVYPNYLVNPVHVIELYQLELNLFGVYDGNTRVILSEWFTNRTTPFLTLFAGVSYLLWVPGPIVYTLYMAKGQRSRMVRYSYAFLLTNFIGFIIYYIYPAAPPWYYINYGSATDFTIPGSEALLSEFDRLIGYPLFNGIYAKNANVFAAVPSLHAAYPVISLIYAIRYKQRNFIIFFSILTIGIWFAAVYSQHHYLIDLLLGLVCAAAAFIIMIRLVKTKYYQKFEQFLVGRLQ